MEQELDDDLYERITELSAEGDALVEDEDYRLAIECYHKALDLLPEPRGEWSAAHWLLTAVGDTHFLAGNYENAADNLSEANRIHGEIEGKLNPFILLRLGQSLFELAAMTNDKEEEEGLRADAADCLTRAYISEGKKIFKGEDRKYLAYVKSKLRPSEESDEGERKRFWPFG